MPGQATYLYQDQLVKAYPYSPKIFSCLNITVLYSSVSLNHDFSSREEKIFTATFSPCQLPLHTSPYRPFPVDGQTDEAREKRFLFFLANIVNLTVSSEPPPSSLQTSQSCRIVKLSPPPMAWNKVTTHITEAILAHAFTSSVWVLVDPFCKKNALPITFALCFFMWRWDYSLFLIYRRVNMGHTGRPNNSCSKHWA